MEKLAFEFVRFMRQVRIDPVKGKCWEWLGNKPDGRYGHFCVNWKTVKAHRWIYEKVVGPIPHGLLLRHSCDNPSCVNPMHLLPGTSKDNNADMHERGRWPDRGGIKHPLAKMTDDDVRLIRNLALRGTTQVAIAEQMKLSRSQVWKIINRTNWDHI